jgi:tetrahydromethanopterin S-methyltransferase subunit G
LLSDFLNRLKTVTSRIDEVSYGIDEKVNVIDYNQNKEVCDPIAKARDINCVLDELNELVDRLENYERRLSNTHGKLGRIV